MTYIQAYERQDTMANMAFLDVFDAGLTRAVGSPHAVFILLGERRDNMSLIPWILQAFARAQTVRSHATR
ncbi:MAG TPA: hypothetical protein VNP04_03545 [Alphaproteobacteria bacterium]|nr:hypothetical protein [Alphaproteobacteria bacterium]